MVEHKTSIPCAELLKQDIAKYGTKYGIQKLFLDKGLCGIETRLFTPSSTADEISESISELNKDSKGVTVRFSHGSELNLPRGFFQDTRQAAKFVDTNRGDRAIILHEFSPLKNSFELFVDDNRRYLQVLPGMWEVDAGAAPDIIDTNDGHTTYWRYTRERATKYQGENNTFYVVQQQPFTFDQLEEFSARLEEQRAKVDEVREIFNPLFCHFFESVDGRFNFINLRDARKVSLNSDSPGMFHTIASASDIEDWDNTKPLLFDVKTEREDDAPLIASINELRERSVGSVYVNYGILSHPAILLREAGIEVKQSYHLYEKRKEGQVLESTSGDNEPIVVYRIENAPHTHTDNAILSLDEITSDMRDLVGGKAYNLALLKNHGIPVPEGFVLTTSFYNEFMQAQGNNQQTVFPQHLIDQLIQQYRELGTNVVAVRSSATIEDSENNSFAGMFRTSLNVSTEDELIQAVLKGFESFNKSHIQGYKDASAISETGSMALVIQPMVDAESSGVMFTRNPVSPKANGILINSTFGIGEKLVSGQVTGDLFTMNDEGQLVSSEITEKRVKLTKTGEVVVEDDETRKPSLNNSQLQELYRYAGIIKNIFGDHQDIEFAVENGEIKILQARPITTL